MKRYQMHLRKVEDANHTHTYAMMTKKEHFAKKCYETKYDCQFHSFIVNPYLPITGCVLLTFPWTPRGEKSVG